MEYDIYSEEKQIINKEKYIDFKNKLMSLWGGNHFEHDLIREIPFRCLAGVEDDEESERFFIRLYNMNEREIYIEKQSSWEEVVYETKASITKAECYKILHNDIAWMEFSKNPIIVELYRQIKYNGLYPGEICEYIHESFLNENEKEKITFDSIVLSTISQVKDFFQFNLDYKVSKQLDRILLTFMRNVSVPPIFNIQTASN